MSDFEVVSNDEIQDLEQGSLPAEITKSHWLNNDNHPNCMSQACRKKFSFFDRQHHCRLCGEIFCSSCLIYRKGLNKLARLDPQGDLYKVCKLCFEIGKDDTVITRNLMEDFKRLKRDVRREVQSHSSLKQTWRDKLNLEEECERLISGFLKSYGKSEMRRSLHEVKTVIKTPDWQKSSVWQQESMADKCQSCLQGFGLLQKKYSCKVCGQCRCKNCCKKELLVYIPDEVKDNGHMMAKLVIIKVIGSPEVEPEVSLLLHVCDRCQDYISKQQISQVEKEQQELEDSDKDVVGKLLRVDSGMSQLQDQITNQLTKFQEVVESLDGPAAQSSGNQSNTQLLAKAQIDIANNLATLYMKVQVVEALVDATQTPTQKKLCHNYLEAISQFYLNNMATHSQVQTKLNNSELLNSDVLSSIQRFVDEKAIVSAQVYLRQLVFETILMCNVHNLHDRIPQLLTGVDMVVAEETCQCLTLAGEDWDLHEKHVNDLVKSQMTDRQLIRTSTRQLAVHKHQHAADWMLQGAFSILQQVKVQLEMKTLNRSFTRTKQELKNASAALKTLKVTDLLKK